MNLVGKIFVSLIAIMSIAFFSLTLVLYANHQNWKEDFEKKSDELKKLEDLKKDLDRQVQNLTDEIENQRVAYQQTIGALKVAVQDKIDEGREKQTSLDLLNQDIAVRDEVIKANQKTIKNYEISLETMRKDLHTAQEERAKSLNELALVTNRMHELASVRGDLEQKNLELTQDFDKAKAVLNMNGLEAEPELYSKTLPFLVKGQIQAIQEGPKGLIMITLGSDDGLNPGHQLEVARDSSYLGKVEVVTVEPHRAVCRILPEYRQGTMKEGDDVVSKFE